MTLKGKLAILAAYGSIKIRYGKLMSVNMTPFDGFRVHVTDEIAHGWIGEHEDLSKAVDIVYQKLKPVIRFQ